MVGVPTTEYPRVGELRRGFIQHGARVRLGWAGLLQEKTEPAGVGNRADSFLGVRFARERRRNQPEALLRMARRETFEVGSVCVLRFDEHDLRFADDGARESVGSVWEEFHLGCETADRVRHKFGVQRR